MSQLLLERLVHYTSLQPEKQALSFLDDAGLVAKSLTYAQVAAGAHGVAQYLESQNIEVGDRVMLVYPPSLDFLIAFLGCLQAGVIAVPAFPPDPRLNKDVGMFATICASCGAKTALTSSSYNYATKLEGIKALFAHAGGGAGGAVWPELKWIVTDAIISSSSSSSSSSSAAAALSGLATPRFAPTASTVAFLQYTSGSTSEPKGVIITQESLAHNLHLITTGLAAIEDTIVVSWLPQYHDMGLIGSYLGALYCGGSGFYLSPLSYIRNPPLWITCISRYRATHMQAPNFAYTLTARKWLAQLRGGSQKPGGAGGGGRGGSIEQGLDLSCVRHMINAAEPVESSAIDTFHAVFGPYGLPKHVIYPTYGLAEHTVYVCSNGTQRLVVDKVALERDRRVREVDKLTLWTYCDDEGGKGGPNEGTAVVVVMGCGKPSESETLDLRIVDTEGLTPVPEDIVGEVWLKSKSMAKGYWNLPEKTSEDFDAALSQDMGEGSILGAGERGFLRTGDLGFLHQGELFICGRLKDLVIIRGRNHYPQDIERTAELIGGTLEGGASDEKSASMLRGGCSAAFSVSIGAQEVLVYAAEVASTNISASELTALMEKIRVEIGKTHGVTPSVLLLLEPRTIPKTTSGKIARSWTRKGYLEGTLKIIASWSNLDHNNSGSLASEAEDSILEGGAGVPAQGIMGAVAKDEDAIDPTESPREVVLLALQKCMAACLESQDAQSVATDVPLMALGMDSIRGVTLQSILERKFTIALPEELMFEPNCTLGTICNALMAGGVFRPPPIMLQAWEVVEARQKQAEDTPKGRPLPDGQLSPQWFREKENKADLDRHSFPDLCASNEAPIFASQARLALTSSWLLLGAPLWLPLTLIALFLSLPLSIFFAILAIIVATHLLVGTTWPSAFTRSAALSAVMRYFSLRIVQERPVNAAVPTMFVFSPSPSHGVYSMPLCPLLFTLLSDALCGMNLHLLVQPILLSMPILGVALKMFGCLPRRSLGEVLQQNRSVIVSHDDQGGSASTSSNTEVVFVRNRDLVRVALASGAQIVPCFCFGSSDVFSSSLFGGLLLLGRFGLPLPQRKPLLIVVGRAIQVPKMENASNEMVLEQHEIYLKEVRRLHDRYKNMHSEKKVLLFQR